MTTVTAKTKKLLLAVGTLALTGCASTTSVEAAEITQFVDVENSTSRISSVKYKLKATPLFDGVDYSEFNPSYSLNKLAYGSHKLNVYANGDFGYNVDNNDAIGHHDLKSNVYFVTNSHNKGFLYDGDATVYNKLQTYAQTVIEDDYEFCFEIYNKLKSYLNEKDKWSYDVLTVMKSDIGDTVGFNSFAQKTTENTKYEEQVFVTLDKVEDKYYFTDVIVREMLEVEGEQPKYKATEMHIDIVHEDEKFEEIVFSKPNNNVAKGDVDVDGLDLSKIDTLK